jgi:hypothetical protein
MVDVFFSYSHQDEDLRNELEIHLAMLKRQGLVGTWHDRRIGAGKEVDGTISEHLEAANIILLLVSPYFLASDYCYELEMRRALERHQANEARVIPIILEPCDWKHAPFSALRATPRDGKPITKFPNKHEGFLEVVEDIRTAAQELGLSSTIDPAGSTATTSAPKSVPRSSNLRIKRQFSDHERDVFVDQVFEYVANYFEGSLQELAARNAKIEQTFRRITRNDFSAAIYCNGQKRSSCRIWLPGRAAFGGDIAYRNSDSAGGGGMNESMTTEDDGHTLGMRPLGLTYSGNPRSGLLNPEGVAEYFWSMLVSPLQ